MTTLENIEELAKRHGATSYRHRTDTANPAFGFTAAALQALIDEVQARDTALIGQILWALRIDRIDTDDWPAASRTALIAARARLERSRREIIS